MSQLPIDIKQAYTFFKTDHISVEEEYIRNWEICQEKHKDLLYYVYIAAYLKVSLALGSNPEDNLQLDLSPVTNIPYFDAFLVQAYDSDNKLIFKDYLNLEDIVNTLNLYSFEELNKFEPLRKYIKKTYIDEKEEC